MRSLKIYLIVTISLFVLYIVVQLNKPKPTNWKETYINTDKIPFGTFILYDRAKDIFPKSQIHAVREPVYNTLADTTLKNTAYVLIGGGIELSKPDYERLTAYIKAGNDVFIAVENFGTLFRKNLKIATDNKYDIANNDELVGFVNPALDPEKKYRVDRQAGNMYFSQLDTARALLLGQNTQHKANFVRFKFGKGSLYLISNPKLFSNYSLLKTQGAEYSAYALSYLNSPKQILWDEYYTQGTANEGSPMKVFLTNAELRWAYYITLGSLLLFVLYEVKRRQRIIPVIEPLKNSTVDFINVVGQVYYEQRDNQNIAHKKILYFLTHVRDRYLIKTNKLDNEFVNTFAAKSGIELNFVRDMVNYINYIAHQSQVSDSELIELNKLIEKFYTLSV
ncbi:hypothetical protein GCM10023149_36210 [Mucilaginibacter gynuensis]|uniref:DUF4350 domain-containing protein n=1 Tax=Mucilaginibacter gynuensis TaxID=1302236 RepID=A0ABP8GVZ6_9SPHI